MRLEHWAVKKSPKGGIYLTGSIYDHPNYAKGREIATGDLTGKCKGQIVTTVGSCYDLGVPDHLYEARVPKAREKLLADLPELAVGAAPQIRPAEV